MGLLSQYALCVIDAAFDELGYWIGPLALYHHNDKTEERKENKQKERKRRLTSLGFQLPLRTSLPSLSHARTFSMVASSSFHCFI